MADKLSAKWEEKRLEYVEKLGNIVQLPKDATPVLQPETKSSQSKGAAGPVPKISSTIEEKAVVGSSVPTATIKITRPPAPVSETAKRLLVKVLTEAWHFLSRQDENRIFAHPVLMHTNCS